ncbi:MAG: hypothetical protein K2K79_00365 [Paramuribaculum sp.]|nr:hypothetical protein [Paramuribaculum sp.]
MNDRKQKKNRNTAQIWLTILAVILVLLILLWQFDALSFGDTDVSAPSTVVEAIMPLML